MSETIHVCYICYDETSERVPCDCQGEMSYVHNKCLVYWCARDQCAMKCRFCQKPYKLSYEEAVKHLFQWTLPSSGQYLRREFRRPSILGYFNDYFDHVYMFLMVWHTFFFIVTDYNIDFGQIICEAIARISSTWPMSPIEYEPEGSIEASMKAVKILSMAMIYFIYMIAAPLVMELVLYLELYFWTMVYDFFKCCYDINHEIKVIC